MATIDAADRLLLSAALPPLEEILLPPIAAFGNAAAKISYRASGNRAAPALVLLHGIGSHSAGYRAQLAGLADRFRVIAWDAPGFGNSSPLKVECPTVDHYVEALAAFIQALGIDQATVVGSSWGSVIAMCFASRYPMQVDRLFLSAPNIAMGHMEGAKREQVLTNMLGNGPGAQTDRDANAARLVAPDTPEEVLAPVRRLRDAVTPVGWEHAVKMMFSVSTPAYLAKVQCPVSIFVGTLDRIAPLDQHAAKLQAAAPRAQLHLFDGVGHMLKLEAPTRFNQAVSSPK